MLIDTDRSSQFVALLFLIISVSFLPVGVYGQDGEVLTHAIEESQSKYNDLVFTAGLELIKKGEYEKASGLWYEAKERLTYPDYRIGQHFIRLVTEQKLKEFYPEACEMYFWGLGASDLNNKKAFLELELDFLKPILDGSRFSDLKKYLKEEDPELFEEIKLIWQSLDPTPLTEYNERLMEHWERIAYANEHFYLPEKNIFDDRYMPLIKYGLPDYKKHDYLTHNANQVGYLLSSRIASAQSFQAADDPVGNALLQKAKADLEHRIRELHYSANPEYEIWIYEGFNSSFENVIYLFGRQNGGRMRHYNSIDDFIPSRAYSMTQRNSFINVKFSGEDQTDVNDQDDLSSGISTPPAFPFTPAIIMQLMYYEQLSALDYFFGSRYNRMVSRYMDQTTGLSMSLAREFQNTNTGTMIELRRMAPVEKTAIDDKIFGIDLNAYEYNFLDDEARPYKKYFVSADIGDAAEYDQVFSGRSFNNRYMHRYEMMMGIVSRNESGRTVYKDSIEVPGSQLNTDVYYMFDFPVKNESDMIVLASELRDKYEEPESRAADDSPFLTSLKANGTLEIEPKLKDFQKDKIQVSDIIIGYPSGMRNNDFLNFEISHEKNIPAGLDLNVYYEIYNFNKEASEKAVYEVTYDIVKDPGKILGLFKGKKSAGSGSVTTTVETFDALYKQSLEIETAGIETGNYVLKMEIKDLKTGQVIEIKEPVNVIKNS